MKLAIGRGYFLLAPDFFREQGTGNRQQARVQGIGHSDFRIEYITNIGHLGAQQIPPSSE